MQGEAGLPQGRPTGRVVRRLAAAVTWLRALAAASPRGPSERRVVMRPAECRSDRTGGHTGAGGLRLEIRAVRPLTLRDGVSAVQVVGGRRPRRNLAYDVVQKRPKVERWISISTVHGRRERRKEAVERQVKGDALAASANVAVQKQNSRQVLGFDLSVGQGGGGARRDGGSAPTEDPAAPTDVPAAGAVRLPAAAGGNAACTGVGWGLSGGLPSLTSSGTGLTSRTYRRPPGRSRRTHRRMEVRVAVATARVAEACARSTPCRRASTPALTPASPRPDWPPSPMALPATLSGSSPSTPAAKSMGAKRELRPIPRLKA
eukprot:scaffold869_cov105-Isochrysis_galbana.AAC.11